MNILALVLIGIMAVLGGGSTIYIVVSMFAILGKKIYRKIAFGASMYD